MTLLMPYFIQVFEAKIGSLEASNQELQATLAAKDKEMADVVYAFIAELGMQHPDVLDFASK